MNEIFISYRRTDSSGQAGHLRKDLAGAFGRDAVMMDVTGLDKGRDFRKTIDSRLANCKVFLAVIGPSWADVKDEAGRRLDSGNDLVRVELAAALQRDIPVIPVLVGGSSMPRAEQLPDDVKELVFRDGVELTHARWDSDVQVLIKALSAYVKQKSSTRRILLVVSGVALLGLGGWGAYQLQQAHDAEIAAREIAARNEASAKQAAEQLAEQEEAKRQSERKAAAIKAAAVKAAADKAAADKAAADKAAADKAAADKAESDRVAAAKVEEQRLDDQRRTDRMAAAASPAAAQAPPVVRHSDSILSVENAGYGPTGARFDVAYDIGDHSPIRIAVQICIKQYGQQIPGTSCSIVQLEPSNDRVFVQMRFTDSPAFQLKGSGQAVVESCLLSYRDSVKAHTLLNRTCLKQDW